jgi:hypothetical protein
MVLREIPVFPRRLFGGRWPTLRARVAGFMVWLLGHNARALTVQYVAQVRKAALHALPSS